MKREIDKSNFGEWLSTATEMKNLVFQALDLRDDDERLALLIPSSTQEDACVFLGCEIGAKLAALLLSHHATVFPRLPGRPYDPYRADLYDWRELMKGFRADLPESYRSTCDWKTYVSYIQVDENNKPYRPVRFVDAGADEILARRLHDHFIEDLTDEFLAAFTPPNGRGIVAIMGGHDRSRSDAVFLQIARIARELTKQGFLIASGGGPGLMEASNLGAFFASLPDGELEIAITEMAGQADRYDDPLWLASAWKIRERFESHADLAVSRSLGVPTWFYGHEPPNVFATHIAKYFENSLREEGLLAIATHGIIFAEGNGGTVQEIFQDACQNYYRNYGFASPMILLDETYWNPSLDANGDYPGKAKPAWPLLEKLSKDGRFQDLITLTSDPDVVMEKIIAFRSPGQSDPLV